MNNKEEIVLSTNETKYEGRAFGDPELLDVPEDIDDVLDDSVGKFIGTDIVEQELPDYDPDVEFEGDENADN